MEKDEVQKLENFFRETLCFLMHSQGIYDLAKNTKEKQKIQKKIKWFYNLSEKMSKEFKLDFSEHQKWYNEFQGYIKPKKESMVKEEYLQPN